MHMTPPPRQCEYAVSAQEDIRPHAEPSRPGLSCFQIDRDRILRCSAFRRMDFKTQVFVPHQNDHFRTRLTHSLEVAQVARNLARALGLNEDLAEAVALAHDLGHPPFGHLGEAILSELMADHGHFEHNRQSLRVIDYLEHPFPAFRGLNLTDSARECLAKHETRYDEPACEQFVGTGLAPLEGQLVDLADELAYSSADLEDALASEWLTEADLADCELWQLAWQRAGQWFANMRPIHHRIQATRAVLVLLEEDLIAATRANIDRLQIASPDDARAAGQKAVTLSPEMARALDGLQRLLFDRVYRHEGIVANDARSRQMLTELFNAFLAEPDLLPDRYRRRIGEPGADGSPESIWRIICDYLAGMTDRFCSQTWQRICGRCQDD
jgi:dGTPase